ncbi:MAG: WecB/TagA/CpsF family glycosyltransferase [Candidatus Staskawiczbacteria bacterium]
MKLLEIAKNKFTVLFKNIIANDLLISVVLWLMLWAGYNTNFGRVLSPGFPNGVFDLIHGLRAFLPLVALVLSMIILFVKRKEFKKISIFSPTNLILSYIFVGFVSAFLSNEILGALWWDAVYGAVISVLLVTIHSENWKKDISFIIKLNLVIATIITIGSLVFFLIQPGVIPSLTYNFLICSDRPYESLAGVSVQTPMLGMVGTRPTGLARYAGLLLVFFFATILYKKNRQKFFYILGFIFFFVALFFTKGKTELVAFVVAIFPVLWFYKKFKTYWTIILGVAIFLTVSFIFYSIPCTNSIDFTSFFRKHQEVSVSNLTSSQLNNSAVQQSLESPSIQIATSGTTIINKDINTILTLSGRITGVWQDAWHLFLMSPVIGLGFHADRYFLAGQHVHNTLLHTLLQTGILGTIPFVLAFILTFVISYKIVNNKNVGEKDREFIVAISAVLVFFVVRGITESFAFYSADWLFMAPIIVYLQCFKGDSDKKNNFEEKTLLNFLGNKINIITLEDSVNRIANWINEGRSKLHWIIVTGMHGVVEAEKNMDFKYIISNADLWVPDGISLVWLAKLKGFSPKGRVSGADLMEEFFKVAEKEGFSSYFYGDTEETLQALNKKLLTNYPKLKIAGSYSPPFRKLTEEEDENIIENINQACPDVLWVALGLPKQEKWIFQHREKLNVPIIIGVGAAFKFLSGKVERSPNWVGNIGFEWLWRLLKEPKVTWRRVFIDMPFFMWLVFIELTGLKRYK